MKAKRYLAGIIILFALAGCGKADVQEVGTEDTEVEQEEKEIVSTEWHPVEGTNTMTYENRVISPMTQSLTRDYFYLISSEEDLDYIEKNYQWKISESDEYPLSKYNYVFCERSFSEEHFHHADYIEYNESLNDIRFHYDIWKQPSPDQQICQTFRVFIDSAKVPKDFFEGKKIERLLSPQEMLEKEKELLENRIIIE